MSFLTLEFAILFLKVLNIDFPLILISLNVVERSLLLYMTLVIVGANGSLTFFKLLILIFHFTLVIHIFYTLKNSK